MCIRDRPSNAVSSMDILNSDDVYHWPYDQQTENDTECTTSLTDTVDSTETLAQQSDNTTELPVSSMNDVDPARPLAQQSDKDTEAPNTRTNSAFNQFNVSVLYIFAGRKRHSDVGSFLRKRCLEAGLGFNLSLIHI